MTTTAAVAVIGGGVIGASIAYHLALEGVDDIVIVDRAPGPGAGSTGKATGGFRAQFATPINIRLSLLSRDALLEFERETGVNPGYEQVGYLWLASDHAQLDALKAANQMQNAEGLHEAIMLDVAEAARFNPLVETRGVIGGAFCPTDGYIKPLEILRGYLESGERLGVRFLWDAECTGLGRSGDRITTVHTSKGAVAVDSVVNAAGPWAASIAAMASISLPVTPLRRQAVFTVPCPVIPRDMPMTIFMDTGFHARARDGRAFLSWHGDEEGDESDSLEADDDWIVSIEQMARAKFPALRDFPIDRRTAYAGLYEMSPDQHAIIGRSPHCANMFLANGSSGHGVMHSPAIGAIVARMMTNKEPQLDVSMLRPSRFAEGDAIQTPELL